MKYTKKQIQEFKEYLDYAIKENYLDERWAQRIIDLKHWDEVEAMMTEGDDNANDNEKITI